MPVKPTADGETLEVAVRYSPDLVAKIKSIPGRTFQAQTKTWRVPISFLPRLREVLPHLLYDPTCDVAFAEATERVEASEALHADEEIVLPGGALRPYQVAGVHYAEDRDGRVMIADEMGLGKTVQTIAYLYRNEHIAGGRIVIVCPAAVKKQWQREFERFVGWDAHIIEGRQVRTQRAMWPLLIINYDILQYWEPVLAPTTLVLDESVALKERKSKRSQAAAKLSAKADHVIALSGRPVLNRPYELWNQLAIVRPDLPLGSWSAFNIRYANYHKGRFGWEMGHAQHLEELEQRLRSTVMVQRHKADVLTELPELQRVTVPMEIDTSVLDDEVRHMEDTWDIAEITELRRLTGLAKVDAAVEWLKGARENLEPLVVFAHHHDVLDKLGHGLDAPVIDGRMPQAERQDIVDDFQGGHVPVLVCGTRAMGMGVNLQVGSNAVFVELDWNMAAHEQAESRLHRMGQRNAVTAYYLVAEDTIDDDLMAMLEEKQEVSEKIVGDAPTPRVLERLREFVEAKQNA